MAGPSADTAPVASARPSMTVRDELRELTHSRLLSAAQAVFERDGYSRTTIGNITKEANVNRATFYLHFTDKADVLMAVLQTNLADTPEYWSEVDAALVEGGRDALRAALGRTLHWYEQHGRLLPSVREATATEAHLAAHSEGTFAGFADEMSGYLASVRPQERDRAHLRLQLLIIQLDQMAFRLIVQGLERIDRDHLVEEITDIWMLVLHPLRRTD